MVVENTTANRGWALPFLNNDLRDDVQHIIDALEAADVDVQSLFTSVAGFAPVLSPAFEGVPTAPTAPPGTDTNQIASTAFVAAAIAALVGLAPATLDTIYELATKATENSDLIDLLEAAIALKTNSSDMVVALGLKADLDEFDDAIDERWVDIDISTLSSGVLEIPDSGTHFNITGTGAADFNITGFGTTRRAGWPFKIRIPRTVANSGGGEAALGHKVAFIHATSGAGLDLDLNMWMDSGTPVYTYNAYPDAFDNTGANAALKEVLEFVPVGEGRHELRGMPEPIYRSTSLGEYWRFANGVQQVHRGHWVSLAITGAWGSLYNSPTITGPDWVAPFSNVPVHNLSPGDRSSQYMVSSLQNSSATKAPDYLGVRASASTASANTQITGYGRWK